MTDLTEETAMAPEMSQTPATAPERSMPEAAPRRRGRPRGATGREPDTLRLEGQTTKSYALGGSGQGTVRYLRLIVNQRQIPDDATVAIEGGRITIEWSE